MLRNLTAGQRPQNSDYRPNHATIYPESGAIRCRSKGTANINDKVRHFLRRCESLQQTGWTRLLKKRLFEFRRRLIRLRSELANEITHPLLSAVWAATRLTSCLELKVPYFVLYQLIDSDAGQSTLPIMITRGKAMRL
jgi:hypothetical protein